MTSYEDRAKQAERAVETMVRQEILLRREIASLRAQLATSQENEQLANGAAELAMKHRDEAEASARGASSSGGFSHDPATHISQNVFDGLRPLRPERLESLKRAYEANLAADKYATTGLDGE
jgi:hypothetical protein